MKKPLIALGLVLSSITASAQDNDYLLPDGIIAIEIQANPFSNDFNTFKMGELKGRLFLDNKSAIRFGIGLGFDSSKDENTTNYDDRVLDDQNYTRSSSSTQTKTKQTTLKLSAGYEYHFAQSGRLDFYAGAEAGYEGNFYSGTTNTNTSETSVSTSGSTVTQVNTTSYANREYTKMLPDASKYNENSIFANIFTGVDFYVYKGLYIGTELGISFKTGKQKNGSYTETLGGKVIEGTQTTSDWTENFSSETGVRNHLDNINKTFTKSVEEIADHSATNTKLKIYVEPALRLGWLF